MNKNTPNVHVVVGGDKEVLPTYHDFNLEDSQKDNADKTFYVAQDAAGRIYGSVMINEHDRKSTGATVGNWIASGLIVTRKDYKALSKTVRLQSAQEQTEEAGQASLAD